MSRILIAGCGYVGTAAADLFHAAGWEVEGWTGSAEGRLRNLTGKPYRVQAVDLTERAKRCEQMHRTFDAVSSMRELTRRRRRKITGEFTSTGRAISARLFPERCLLFTSSTSVYAQTDGEWVTEASPAEPERATGKILRETEAVSPAERRNRGAVRRHLRPGSISFARQISLGRSGDRSGIRTIHQQDPSR